MKVFESVKKVFESVKTGQHCWSVICSVKFILAPVSIYLYTETFQPVRYFIISFFVFDFVIVLNLKLYT